MDVTAPRVARKSEEPAPSLAISDPGTISIQIRPELVRVVHFKLFRWWVTAIMRHWRPGDAGRCRLCGTCSARRDGCLVVVRGRVEKEEAPLFDLNVAQFQNDPPTLFT